mmetsp:Transcript_13771/g.22946  ORF Transcript_13771/g.22946 Transcript_13771/m.22946 type:complete len:165 (-) Transcript_13771:39-533(-)
MSGRSVARSALSMLSVGDQAPDFALKNFEGKTIKLSQFKKKKPVVVFFYPGDNTPGCTQEVCAFEKRAPDFKALGAEVIGISSGSAEDKAKFIRTNSLTAMELLIDDTNEVRNSWEVPKALFGVLPGRVTYILGKDGTVKSIYNDLANAKLHPDKAIEALQASK